MPTAKKSVAYRRRGSIGSLTLLGSIDMFEAAAFHEAAKKALGDTQAATLQIEMAGMERMDLSALQILHALRRDVTASGRSIEIVSPTERVRTDAETAGTRL